MKKPYIFLLAATAMATPVFAQSDRAPRSSAALSEILVTAEKRVESLQDTPISISALDAGALEAKRVVSLGDLSVAVPNMQVSTHPNSATTLRVTIRGIGEVSAVQTRDAPVAIYMDGVYVAKGQGLANEVADLERVEVLRGPQGTLYGRNATAGAINFITRAPELGEWKAKQSLTFGSRSEFRSRTSVNIPIGDDLAAELVYLRAKKHGFVKNIGPGAKRFGDTDRHAVRGALRWSPTPEFEARYTYDSSWIKDTPYYLQEVPLYPERAERARQGDSVTEPLRKGDSRVQTHNLTLSYDMNDELSLKSVTGYQKLNDNTYQVYNPGPVRPFLPFFNNNMTDQKQFSQELQLIGDTLDGGLKYILGLYYFSEKGWMQDNSDQPLTGLQPRTANWDNKAYAIFGQASWTPDILDGRLHLTAGARWSKDKRWADVYLANLNPLTVLLEGEGSQSFTDFSPTGTIQFDVNDDVNIYAKVAKGYKTGGFNPTASSAAAFAKGFGPETLVSYEAGLKSELFDRRVRFNIAGYYSKYKDIQVSVFDPFNNRVFDVINAGRAVTQGFEADLTAVVFEGMTVSGSYGYVDPKFKEVVDLGGNDVTPLFHFAHAPKNSFTLEADYKSEATEFGVFEANLNYAWQGEYFGLYSDSNIITKATGMLGGRIGVSDVGGVEGLRLAVWGRNLTNAVPYTVHFAVGDIPMAMVGEPRSFGVDLSMEF